ncbi:MAG: alpha/beta hydrolase family protein [Oligoflexales bacterium]
MISSRSVYQITAFFLLLNFNDYGIGQIAACNSMQEQKIEQGLHAVKSGGKFYLNHLNLEKKQSNYFRYDGEISFPETGISHEFLYYETKKSDAKQAPLLIIYPGIGGTTYFEKYLANHYTSKGMSVVISHYLDEHKLHNIDNISSEMISNLRVGFSLVDFFSTLPNIDSDRISILGISYGGIRGVYHTALDKRINSTTLMVAGAPFEEILAFSSLDMVTEIRSQQMNNASITDNDEYLSRIKKEIFPISDFLCQRESEEFYLIISDDDKWVPSKNQWQLWEMLGKPKYEKSELGHIGTPLWLGLKKINFIHEFFASLWNIAFAGE